VAPTYGDAGAEARTEAPPTPRGDFLGCKTQERTYEGAWRKLDQSLNRLGVDTIDLYQVHGLEYDEELDEITGDDGGALAAFREAKEQGLIDHMGLTSHGDPGLILDALDRIDDLESVMFPLNPVVAGKDDDEYDYEAVLARADEKNVGTLGIKAFAGGSWPRPTSFPRRTDRSRTGTDRSPRPTRSASGSTSPPHRDSPASSTPAIRSSSP